jgi:NAD(P)-dependent dehydrogenase (short-subunit alcohol dehydrogenase family)
MRYNLADKAVVLTGGSRGIGRATALALAKEGCHLALIARNETKLNEVAGLIKAEGGQAWPIVGDVSDDMSTELAVSQAADVLGDIDVFLNIAGITLEKRIEDAQPDDYRRVMETNFLGAVRCNRHALPFLKRNKGVVVNVTSIIVRSPFPRLGVYAASKWALAAYSHTLRQELFGTGVRVLTVYPAVIRTDMLDEEPVLANTPTQSAERCARAIVRAIKKGKKEAGTAWLPLLSRLIFGIHPPLIDIVNRRFLPQD